MSSMMRSSDRDESWMIRTIRECSGRRSVRARISDIPTTPFIGVRISWLILARKVLLALLASSAFFLAISSSRVRSVTCSVNCPESMRSRSSWSVSNVRFRRTR